MIFADTGARYAITVPEDPRHAQAHAWLARNKQPLVTTDYVIDETLTLIRARGEYRRAETMGRQFFGGGIARIEYVRPEDIQQAWQTFRRFSDKEWSFTDCTSKIIMERLGLTQAFAFDQHFRQFGTVEVVP